MTKVRVVFDASSHDKDGILLNECLYAGPNLNPEPLSALFKFRENRIAFTADIKKAISCKFLSIKMTGMHSGFYGQTLFPK